MVDDPDLRSHGTHQTIDPGRIGLGRLQIDA
jgi:hypothetical protein